MSYAKIVFTSDEYLSSYVTMMDKVIYMNDISIFEKDIVYKEVSNINWGRNYLMGHGVNMPGTFMNLEELRGEDKYLSHIKCAMDVEKAGKNSFEIYINAAICNCFDNLFDVADFAQLLGEINGDLKVTYFISLNNNMFQNIKDDASEFISLLDVKLFTSQIGNVCIRDFEWEVNVKIQNFLDKEIDFTDEEMERELEELFAGMDEFDFDKDKEEQEIKKLLAAMNDRELYFIQLKIAEEIVKRLDGQGLSID